MEKNKGIGKKRFQPLLLVLTLASLITLVGIQVTWTIRAARMQETEFNHSVTMAMNRAIDNLALNTALCDRINHCLINIEPGSCAIVMQNLVEWDNIKSVIEEDMKYYGIDLDFEFDIIKPDEIAADFNRREIYLSESLEDLLEKTGYKLSIRFPGRRDFIIAQMGSIFVVSIILLVIVSLSSIIIYRFYRREQDISANVIDFVNSMTHAFKTPLTNISLANSMIAKSNEVSADKRLVSYTGIIRAEHNKLKERVDRLLKTTFSETDPPSFHELIDVNSVAGEIIGSFSVQVSERGGSITLEIPEGALFISGNPDLFSIALANLVDNSIKYSNGPPEIVISVKKENRRVIIWVEDKGIGVPHEHLDNIFKRYFRITATERDDNEGFGLGLYQVKDIIARMGGEVWAILPAGVGLRIIIELSALKER